MMDNSYNTIIDTNKSQIGQVTRINITNDGIFRVFYNDISGNMRCGLSRQSNYKQVILDTSTNRSNFDVSNIPLNNFESPLYGGTFHGNEISGNIQKAQNFYTFLYRNAQGGSIESTNIGPWRYFTELTFQNFIKQGDTPVDISTSIYDTTGFSSILANGKNSLYDPSMQPVWFNQLGSGWGISDFSNNFQEIGVFIPDVLNLYGQNVDSAPRNYSLNNNKNNSLSFTIPNSSTMSISTSIYGGYSSDASHNIPPGINYKPYYSAAISPNYIRIDDKDNATPSINGDISSNDTYYKGRWSIWVDCSSSTDTSGNIYLARKSNSYYPDFYHNVYDHFTNASVGETNIDISNVFVDIDIDPSNNSIINNGNYNHIYSRPYFSICSDASNSILIGRAAYDLSKNNLGVLVSGSQPGVTDDVIGTLNLTEFSFAQQATIDSTKYCKIKVDQPQVVQNSWNNTRWHSVYWTNNGTLVSGTKKEVLWYNTGIFDINGDLVASSDISYNLTYDNTTGEVWSGYFPSLDISRTKVSNEWGEPCVAYFSNSGSNATSPPIYPNSIYFAVAENSKPADNEWTHYLIDKDVVPSGWTFTSGIGDIYGDLSNNQPISLKISPNDNSAHICYQKYNENTENYELKYWTNSYQFKNISKVDSSLNYIGIHSQGKTIDISEAYVEVYWDLSKSNCIFSRDYTRYDNQINTGLTDTQLKIQKFISPFGGRTGKFGKTDTYKSPIIYNGMDFDKIYIVCSLKTPTTFNDCNNLFFLGGTESTGGYIGGLKKGLLYFGVKGPYGGSNYNTTNSYIGPFLDSSQNSSGYYTADTGTNAGIPIGISGGLEPQSGWSGNEYDNYKLSTNTKYQLEFYYNKTNYYLQFKVSGLTGATGLYQFFDISQNGGLNMLDGYLSIYNGSHLSSIDIWNGSIYKMSIYATDISNTPLFDLSRNFIGGSGTNTIISQTPFSSYFDNSMNEGLNIEPDINKYQVINAQNKLNESGDILGSSIIKSTLLHDIYYYQRIINQENLTNGLTPGQYITAFDKFSQKNTSGFYDLWSIGYITSNDGKIPKIWSSIDGGNTWLLNSTFVGISGEQLLNIKTFTDKNNGKWIFVCGENYFLQYSSNYNNDGTIGAILGNTWNSLLTNFKFGNGNSTNLFDIIYNSIYNSNLGKRFDFNSMDITNIHNDNDIFNTSPPTDSFYIWLGTDKYTTLKQSHTDYSGALVNIFVPTGYSWASEIWWKIYPGTYTSDPFATQPILLQTRPTSSGWNPPVSPPINDMSLQVGAPYTSNNNFWFPEGDYTAVLYDTYGDGWHGHYFTVTNASTNSQLASLTWSDGGYGPKFVHFTVSGANDITPYFTYPYNYPAYRDLVLRIPYGSGNSNTNANIDISKNILIDMLYDNSGNPNKDINIESFTSFDFGGDPSDNNYNIPGINYGIMATDSYVYTTKNGGSIWSKKLGVDRKNILDSSPNSTRGTYGTYIEKNPKSRPGEVTLPLVTDLVNHIIQNTADAQNNASLTNIATTSSGDGIGAILKLVIAGNIVTSIVVTTIGNGYRYGDTLTVDKSLMTNSTEDLIISLTIASGSTAFDPEPALDYFYDNSGMYIQTSTEPWNGYAGLIMAYNDSSYNLTFNPIDSSGIKTTVWDPSMNDIANFWNPQILDNEANPVLFRKGGGNTIKINIEDNASVNNTYYKYKQQLWAFDSYIEGDHASQNTIQTPSLYLKDSENNNMWQRINFSVVDPSLNNYSETYSTRWDSFNCYDTSYSIVNLPYISNIADQNIYYGFYKVGKVPFQISLQAVQGSLDLYSAVLTLQYKLNPSITYNMNDIKDRLNFDQLDIKVYIEKIINPDLTTSVWEDIPFTNRVFYSITQQNLQPGAIYQFRARLKNNYGYGWYSTPTDPIIIPSPQPIIKNLQMTSKLFENRLTWEPGFEIYQGVSLQSIYSYNIEKQYLDISGTEANWVTDISFTNFYTDISKTLISDKYGTLQNSKWTGEDVFNNILIDYDLSLNMYYRYVINGYSDTKDKSTSSSISRKTFNGYPIRFKNEYTINDASFNVNWTLPVDISDNTDVIWDISWQEIYDGGNSNGEYDISFPQYKGNDGVGKERKTTLPLTQQYLYADASYNVQIKFKYQNSSVQDGSSNNVGIVGGYQTSSPYEQAVDYCGQLILNYYNYQQEPVLKDASYNVLNNILSVNLSDRNVEGTYLVDLITKTGVGSGATASIYTTNTTVINAIIEASGNNYVVGDHLIIPRKEIRRNNGDDLEFELVADDIDNGELKIGRDISSDISFGKISSVLPISNHQYYDISFSNTGYPSYDISYNKTTISTSFIDNSGTSYYPGSYKIRSRTAYGDSVPTVNSLFSKWSRETTISSIPQHKPPYLKIIPYDVNDISNTVNDISYVKLEWISPGQDDYNIPGYPIPKNYKIIRKTTSKDYNNYQDLTINNIPSTDTSYNDILNDTYAEGNPRIWNYTLETEY